MMDRKYELGHERVGRLLVRYSAPAMFAMFVNSMYNVVDTIFVGRGAGTLALAGLAVSFPIQMFILASAQVVGIGSASLISRSLGAGLQRKAERTAGTSFATVGLMSAVITGLGISFLRPLLKLFGATPAVLPYGVEYLSVIFLGSFFWAFAISSNNVVRSEGNAKIAMVSMLIGAITNIILDPIFIFGLDMGIRGAAVATVIAHTCVFVFLCGYFMSGKSMLRIRRADLIPDLSLLPEVFAVGASSFARVAAGSVLAIVLNNSIGHYGSDVHLAVLGVLNRVMMFMLMPLFGLVQGTQPIVGFNYGAKNVHRVKEAVGKASLAATVIASVGFAFVMTFPRPIFALFSKDPVLISEGVRIIRVAILMVPCVGFQIIGSSMFQALGKALPALFLSMSRQVLFLIPLILLIPLRFGLMGIWMSFPMADFMSLLVTGTCVLATLKWMTMEHEE